MNVKQTWSMKHFLCSQTVMTFAFLLITIVLLSPSAHAQVLTSIGSSLVFENAPNGRTLETRQPLTVRGGYRFALGDLYLEYSSFRAAQGATTVQVARTHTEWLVWARRVLAPQMKLAPYAASALGVQYDTVETSLGTEGKKNDGNPHAVVAVAGGFLAKVRENLELQVESKIAASTNYSPNPLLSLGFLLGWRW